MPSPVPMKLVTSLGDTALLFRSMSARDEMSRLFEYQVVGESEQPDIEAKDLLGKPASVCLELGGGQQRWFHGIVAAFGIDGVEERRHLYGITLRPWLWLATRAANLRIFQDMTAPDIIKKVLASYTGVLKPELSGTYAKRTYCVQYRETDFNFVSRLMEEEGIFYFFRQTDSQHELVLADAANAHQPFKTFAEVVFDDTEDRHVAELCLQQWRTRHEIQTGKVTLRDYNFETPSTDLLTNVPASSRTHGEAAHEVYDYPGLYGVLGDGSTRAGVRLDEAESRHARFTGAGNVTGLVAGGKFKLIDHPRADQNVDYIVLGTQITMEQSRYNAGGQFSHTFHCSVMAQPYAEPFRPARITPKPHVAGPQTAVVVGGGEAEGIYTDKYARVKVQFHWDRLGKKDMTSSCWIRVASPVAGSGWGMISIPRVGQEVVVDFLEGDPDQPLITGRVHNAEQLPPYELPANATVSTLKTRSKGGAVADFNELRFEDKAGSEYVLLHAQKDRIEFVEQTLNSDIGKDEHRTVKGNRKEKISGDHHVTVDKDVKQKITNALSVTTGKDMLFKSGATWGLKAAQDITAESGTAISLKAGTDMHMKVGMNLGVDAGMNVHIKAGMNLVLEAGVQISIKAGPASVVLGPSGVSITGPMVMINSGGAAGSGNGASPVAPTAPQEPEAPDPAEDPLKAKHR